jgi:hypothetical protein
MGLRPSSTPEGDGGDGEETTTRAMRRRLKGVESWGESEALSLGFAQVKSPEKPVLSLSLSLSFSCFRAE